MACSAFSASFLIAAGTFGSFVASASWTLISPSSIWTDFTRPNEMISRVKPGYFTDLKAFFTCSSEIDISETYACRGRGKPCAGAQQGKVWIGFSGKCQSASDRGQRKRRRRQYQAARPQSPVNALRTTRSTESQSSLSVLIIHFIPNLIFVSARGMRGLLAPFGYKVRVLPVGPGAVFRPHWIRRQLEPEDSVCGVRKFQHEEPLRSAEIQFHVTGARARIFRRVGVPVTWHRVAVCIELGLDVGKIFDGLTSGWFHFKLEQRRRAIDVQNMWLTGIPNSDTGHRNKTER